MIPPTPPVAGRDDAIVNAADSPMTDDQADMLRSLCEDASEPFNANLTEAEALVDHAGDLDIYESQFKPMKHTISGRDERTLLKMIVCRSTDRGAGYSYGWPRLR